MGQLITDSQLKLKTVDKRSSFLAKQRKSSIAPGFASEKPFHHYKISSPRFTTSAPYGGVIRAGKPRISKGSPFGGVLVADKPRYSKGLPFGGVVTVKTPRYTKEAPFGGVITVKAPRYSPGNPFGGVVPAPAVRYSPKGSPFDRKYKHPSHSRNPIASFTGPQLVKGIAPDNSHPSARYSPKYRKLYLTWARYVGNNSSPDGVKENVAKPKFDRKEREIWHN